MTPISTQHHGHGENAWDDAQNRPKFLGETTIGYIIVNLDDIFDLLEHAS
jgi:hypothetical protein